MLHRRSSLSWLAPVGLTLIGFCVRVSGLGLQPLWGDEGWSYYFARMALPEMLYLTARDIHPPLYYAVLSGWLAITGGAPEAARLLSVIAGTLLVPVMHRLAANVYGRHAALTAAALTAVAPLAVYYSQEVRMYGLVTLLGLGSVACLHRLLVGRAGWRTAIAYVVITAAALYTMYYAVLVLLAQAAWLVSLGLTHRGATPRLRRAAMAMLASGLLYLPWVIYAGGQLLGYVQGKRAAEGYLPLEPTRYLAAHLVAMTGWAAAMRLVRRPMRGWGTGWLTWPWTCTRTQDELLPPNSDRLSTRATRSPAAAAVQAALMPARPPPMTTKS